MLRISGQRYSPLALLCMALVFICCAPLFWLRVELPQGTVSPSLFKHADLYERTYPDLSYGFARLAAGELPLWNPYQHCGAPFQADPATGLFQPLNAMFLLIPPDRALALSAFICLFLMGFFFALFLRALGLRYLSCLFGGLAYAFSGASAAAMSRPDLAAVLAWAPLLFWAAREFGQQQRLGVLVLGGLAGAGMLLSGGYGIAAVLLLAWLPYAVLGVWRKQPQAGRAPIRGLAGVLFMVAIMLGISAVQWMPALAWSGALALPAALFQVDLPAVLPRDPMGMLAQWLGGRSEMLPRPGYLGLGVVLALPAAFFHRQARLETACFALLAAVAVVLALTPWQAPGPLPQAAWLFVFSFALATLAGIGVDRLFTVSRDPRSPFVWLPVLMLLLLAVALLYAGAAQVRALVLVYLLLLLPFLVLRARWLAPVTAVAVTLFLFIDCSLANVNYYRHPFADGPAVSPEVAEVLRQAEEHAVQGRMFQWGTPAPQRLPANLGTLAQRPMAGGTPIPLPVRQQQWTALLQPEVTDAAAPVLPAHPRLLNHMAVRVLLVGEDRAFGITAMDRDGVDLTFLRARNQVRLYENQSALPRAYWTPAWRRSNSLEETLALLESEERPGEVCVLEGEEEMLSSLSVSAETDALGASATPVPGTLVESRPERVVVQLEAPQAGLLVLADTHAPGWRAWVDDAPAPILLANGIFRAVPVPEGAHLVVFEYVPAPFWTGLAISLCSLAGVLLLGLLILIRR